MYWVNLLHFYQPVDQRTDVLETITRESYFPLLKSIDETLSGRGSMTFNINAALLRMWSELKRYEEVLNLLRDLIERSVVELTSSGMYHPFLPILPEEEIRRQIELNSMISKKALGTLYNPKGFFPPEMGYSELVMKVITEYGFDWVVLDEIALDGQIHGQPITEAFLHHDFPRVSIIFVQRPPGYLGIMRGVIMEPEGFYQRAHNYLGGKDYLVTATDAEIYGYHRPDQEKKFDQLLRMKEVKCISYSEYCELFPEKKLVKPLPSSWSTTPDEMQKGRHYPFWNNPDGLFHRELKRLLNIAIEVVDTRDKKARDLLDKAETSDTFWWSSQYKSWWSTGLLEKGARLMRDAIVNSIHVRQNHRLQAEGLYRKIVLAAIEWEFSEESVKIINKDLSETKKFEQYLAQIF